MVDFSVFDSISDFVFVIDVDGRVVYCNDTAATFSGTSSRRLVGKTILSEVWTLAEPGILPWGPTSQGFLAPTPFIETAFEIAKIGKTGKVQLAVRPLEDGKFWGLFIKDVSLEETLATKYRSELAKTEAYARNLEKLVEARTAELNRVNQTMQAILNSLGQGFFTFNGQGDCGPVFTKAVEEVLEGDPIDRKAWDVLGVTHDERPQFLKWIATLFQEPLPFEDLKNLGPNIFPHSFDKHVTLEYYPIRSSGDAVSDVVVVATDKTAEHRAQIELEAERAYAAMIVKYTRNKDQFLQVLVSTKDKLTALDKIAGQILNRAAISESFRLLHTIEGEAGTFSLEELRQMSRASQQILEPFKADLAMHEEGWIAYRASLAALAQGFEQFLTNNRENFQLPEGDVSRLVELPIDSVETFLNDLEATPAARTLTSRYQDLFLKAPISSRLKYYDGLVSSVAERLNKRIKPILIEGGDVRIFPESYAGFFSSLVHAFRNAVDHGLEAPDDREWAGKDPSGQISISVTLVSGVLKMRIQDDGRGIDPAIIRAKLPEKFPGEDFSQQSDEEIIQTVCRPGFSSRDQIGEFSGRGVGLDALKEEVLKLSGNLHIKSKVGLGTTIDIELPELDYRTALLRSA